MEMKIKISKEDWEKMLKDANMLAKESSINLLVYQNTADLAREHLKNFADDKITKDYLKPPQC